MRAGKATVIQAEPVVNKKDGWLFSGGSFCVQRGWKISGGIDHGRDWWHQGSSPRTRSASSEIISLSFAVVVMGNLVGSSHNSGPLNSGQYFGSKNPELF